MESSDFAHEMSLASGQRFFEKLASTGGTCDTYRVRINGKWHFLKRPKGEMSSNPLYITAFEREFDIGYRLEHKSLVRYIDKGIDQQGIYILTEMIDGCTLDEFVAKNPEYFKNKKHVERFVSQMLDVLDYLHNNQVLHLDLKPSNIIITRTGHNVKLVDLGFAYSDCYQSIAAGMTREYAAPEQLDGGEVGPWTDIYSFGKVLLKLFNNGKSQDAVQSVPSYYRNFVKKCVERTPDQRFATVADAQHSLSKKQIIDKLIVRILISIVTLLILIIWGINYVGSIEDPQTANKNITKPHNSIDSIENMANHDSAQEKKMINDSESSNYQISPQNKQNQEANINSASSATEHKKATSDLQADKHQVFPQEQKVQISVDTKGVLSEKEQIKIITAPEALKSQLHAKSKTAFTTLEHKYVVIDDYKTRADLLIEIKNARLRILEFAKSQASDNRSKEEYYKAALDIVNEEYEHSNLPKKLKISE